MPKNKFIWQYRNGSSVSFKGNDSNEGINIIIPAVDNEVIEPKVKIYEPDGITYWCPEIGFNRFTDANRK